MEISDKAVSMSQSAGKIRERIQAQGFCDLNDAMYSQINFPLRLAPALCMVWAAVGTALGSATILWFLAPFAAFGAILPGHPFDIFYNYGLRHLFGTSSAAALRSSAAIRMCGCDDVDRHSGLGISIRPTDCWRNRRLVGCGRHVCKRNHGNLYAGVSRADILRRD